MHYAPLAAETAGVRPAGWLAGSLLVAYLRTTGGGPAWYSGLSPDERGELAQIYGINKYRDVYLDSDIVLK